jgi:hypothetical protein
MSAKDSRKPYTDKSGKSGRISPAIVEKYLAGMHFPAGTEKLARHAKSKGAPAKVIILIDKLPDKIYMSPIDITREIGKTK